MKLVPVFVGMLVLATFASASTTNLNNQRINTYDVHAEGHIAVGTTWNNTLWQLFVTNESRFVRASTNDSLTVGGADVSQATSYHEGPAFFNSTVTFVDGSIDRDDLPATIAYEDEANTFSVRQIYSDGFTAGANAYHDALTQMNSTTLIQWLYVIGAVDVNGSFTASSNSYLEGAVKVNSTVNIQNGATCTVLLCLGQNLVATGSPSIVINDDPAFRGEFGYSEAGTTILYIANSYNDNAAAMDFRIKGVTDTQNVLRLTGDGNSQFYGNLGIGAAPTSGITINAVAASGPVFRLQRDDASDFRFDISADGSDLAFTAQDGGGYLFTGATRDFEVDGPLNHDGSTVGLYGKTPVVQHADIPNMVDNTGGTISSTCAAIAAGALYAQADMVAAKNCLASLLAKINLLEAAIEEIGITA